VTYTINGKEYTEFDINVRCAELMGYVIEDPLFNGQPYVRFLSNGKIHLSVYEPTTNPVHAWPIIEKCWDDLMIVHVTNNYYANWDLIMDDYKCTKLVAACICFIEINDGGAK
jgi:hypothetical protein